MKLTLFCNFRIYRFLVLLYHCYKSEHANVLKNNWYTVLQLDQQTKRNNKRSNSDHNLIRWNKMWRIFIVPSAARMPTIFFRSPSSSSYHHHNFLFVSVSLSLSQELNKIQSRIVRSHAYLPTCQPAYCTWSLFRMSIIFKRNGRRNHEDDPYNIIRLVGFSLPSLCQVSSNS
jgi:hypothetical protein